MAIQSVKLAGKKFVILPEKEFTQLNQEARQHRQRVSRMEKPSKKHPPKPPSAEIYDDERIAEFILSNAVDAEDYANAQAAVRGMGLDPAAVRHYKPAGVK